MHRKGVSKGFCRAFGYRVMLLEAWNQGPGSFELHIQQQRDGQTFVAKPVELVFEPRQPGFGIVGRPFFTINADENYAAGEGNQLLEALEAAFHPRDLPKLDAVEAMGRHLEDMRSLVFKRPPLEKP